VKIITTLRDAALLKLTVVCNKNTIMIKFLILLFITTLFFEGYSQILNPSFEETEQFSDPHSNNVGIKPKNWSSSFYQSGFEITDDSYVGNSAMKIWSWYFGQSYTELFYGDTTFSYDSWSPINVIPKKFMFNYKFIEPCTYGDKKDSAYVQIAFSKYNTVLDKRDTLELITARIPEVQNYIQFDIPLNIPSSEIPDSVQIIFRSGTLSPSKESECSYLFIDNVSFSENVGLEGKLTDNLTALYPNPTTGFVNFKSNDKITSLSIFNSLGKTVMDIEEVNKYFFSFDIKSLATGTYFVEFHLENSTISRQRIIKE
jgi:hypothetical protein